MPALLHLVNLPGEREKDYAKSYRKSQNTEALRQYINKLMPLYDKHLKKADRISGLPTESLVANAIEILERRLEERSE
jgi:hypothetical protein